jgi:hypothetical protein
MYELNFNTMNNHLKSNRVVPDNEIDFEIVNHILSFCGSTLDGRTLHEIRHKSFMMGSELMVNNALNFCIYSRFIIKTATQVRRGKVALPTWMINPKIKRSLSRC